MADLTMLRKGQPVPFLFAKNEAVTGRGKPAAARVEGIGICLAVLFKGLSDTLESFFDVFERRGV